MTTVNMTDEERTLLADVIEGYLSELRMEIGDTDSKDYREMLKDRKDILLKILSILQSDATRQ